MKAWTRILGLASVITLVGMVAAQAANSAWGTHVKYVTATPGSGRPGARIEVTATLLSSQGGWHPYVGKPLTMYIHWGYPVGEVEYHATTDGAGVGHFPITIPQGVKPGLKNIQVKYVEPVNHGSGNIGVVRVLK